MPDETQFTTGSASGSADGPVADSPARSALDWTLLSLRPAGTLLAVTLMILITVHAINGKHGLSVWRQKQVEDQQLRKEIADLQQENARLRAHVERLKSDPDAIETEARRQLHYTRPGEVVYVDPTPPAPQQPPPTQTAKPGILAAIKDAMRDVMDAAAHLFGGESNR